MSGFLLHQGDLPKNHGIKGAVAVDAEATGLSHVRDRLCLMQLRGEDGQVHLVKFGQPDAHGRLHAPNLAALLADKKQVKIFHFGRFDLAMAYRWLGVETAPVFCTKIASKLVRTYTDRHGLKDVCRELLGVELSKESQSSDWAADHLSEAQLAYAASDVLHLHALRDKLSAMLVREGRDGLAAECFAFLPTRAILDVKGWAEQDIFAHN